MIGTEDAFKRTADTRDGDSLADADRYKDAIGELEEDRLGHYYVDVKPLLDAAIKQDPEAARSFEQFKSVFPFDKLGPITGAFTANGDGMALDTRGHRRAGRAVPQPRRSSGRAAGAS